MTPIENISLWIIGEYLGYEVKFYTEDGNIVGYEVGYFNDKRILERWVKPL